MLENMPTTIIICYKTEVENRIFNGIRTFNACFNQINSLNCHKDIWIDECYISFTFRSEKSFKKALKILNPTY